MKQATQTMTAKRFHHGTTLALGVVLNGLADIIGGVPGFDDCKTALKAFPRHIHQALCLALGLACHIHARCVAMPAIDDHGDINVQDVAFLERLVMRRNAVTDDVIDRGTEKVLVAAIKHRGRNRA